MDDADLVPSSEKNLTRRSPELLPKEAVFAAPVLLLAEQSSLQVSVYTPLQVKMAVSGYGRADKKQVAQMVKTILKLSEIPKLDDTTDALAIAVTHALSYKMKR